LLLTEPFVLIVASYPLDAYPQELALRFAARPATETRGVSKTYFRPDAEIAGDFSALLTLLCRRLVTVACRVRETFQGDGVHELLRDYPNPITSVSAPTSWKLRPLSLSYGLDGVYIHENQPPPVAIDARRLSMWLKQLPFLAAGEAIVRTARLYALSLELIETRVEIAYQMLISAVETMASASLTGWAPDTEQLFASKSSVIKLAEREGLGEEAARRLALEVCKDNPWSRRKFKKFLVDNVAPEALETDDELFPVPKEFCPTRERFEKSLDDVYSMRSGASHSGRPFPATASIGPSPGIPSRAVDSALLGEAIFPPIGWFERVVNDAVCRWIDSAALESAKKKETPKS
jgi:hypothetical protein